MQRNRVAPQAVSEFGSVAARLPIEQDGFPTRPTASPFDHNVGAE
jgi:hypothetical protein